MREKTIARPAMQFPIAKDSIASLSDNIMGVAITLMLLFIKVPDLSTLKGNSDDIGTMLTMAPMIYGYLRAFIVMGIAWLFLRWMYSLMDRIDFVAFLLTLLYLLMGTLWPLMGYLWMADLGDFKTGNWAVNMTIALEQLGLALSGLALWFYVSYRRRLIDPGVTAWQIRIVYLEISGLVSMFLAAIGLLIVFPPLMPPFIFTLWVGFLLVSILWQDMIFSAEPPDNRISRVIKALPVLIK